VPGSSCVCVVRGSQLQSWPLKSLGKRVRKRETREWVLGLGFGGKRWFIKVGGDRGCVWGIGTFGPQTFDCYCDAGFETDRDDIKSQTRYVFILNRGAVDWKSSKQSAIAMSATKVEYIAASEAALEAVWIRKFILGLDDANNYVPPSVQKNDMMLSVIEQMKSQVEKCNMFDECIKKRTTLSPYEIGTWEQSDIKENIANDIMCTYLRPLNEVDNCGKCKSLDIVLLDLQESNKSLFQKIEDENVSLAFYVSSLVKEREHIKLEYKKLYDSIKQTRVKTKLQTDSLQQKLNDQIYKNNKLRAQLKGNFLESQMNHNGTSVNNKLSRPSTSGNKLYSVTLLPKSKVIPKVVEKNDLSKSVPSHLNTKKIIEKCTKVLALVYVSASCRFTQSGNEKWAPTKSHRKNNKPYVYASRTKQTIETITKEHAVKQNTRKTDNTMLPSTGRVSSTNASGSKPRSNTKNDTILQPSSRSMKNKVEAQHRKFKSSANKNNHVADCNANVRNVALSKNSNTICLSCNEYLFSANHDACVVQYLRKMQKCKVAKSAKQKAKIVPPEHILTTTLILVDVPCPKLSLRYANARESLSKCMLNSDFHPFNLHDFGFKGIIRDEELPP
ncbi:hypothetical protein Tco_1274445, partial [Tanacetum coccineum]